MNIEKFQYNPLVESIVQVLMDKTQNYDPNFFRLQTVFFLSLVPSNLHISVETPTGCIPINVYGINLSQSGSGKGVSTYFLEQEILGDFRNKLNYSVLPRIADMNMDNMAIQKSAAWMCTHQEAKEKLEKEYLSYGAHKFSVDNATVPAIKQYRNKILLGNAGAITLISDEIGSNLSGLTDNLSTFLELYDRGTVKDKLTKNTKDSERYDELFGSTPTNLMLFGTPSKLLDGAKVEESFFSWLEQGYARRCFIAYGKHKQTLKDITPEQLYDLIANGNQTKNMQSIARKLANLADVGLVGSKVTMDKNVTLFWLEYRIFCEKEAEKIPEHHELLRTELIHSYFKVIKLAGLYAVLDNRFHITIQDVQEAIRFAWDTGKALKDLMQREKPYVRLAKHIVSAGKSYTHVDLMEELPYYPNQVNQRIEMIKLATAWGYTNGIVIKTSILDGVEFFSGDSLKETKLDELRFSVSQDLAYGYEPYIETWEKLQKLVVMPDYHWANHYFVNNHRHGDNVEAGFNILVLDVDDGTPLSVARDVLKDHAYIIHTTKRHQQIDENGEEYGDRFRVIIPMNYTLSLSEKDYKQFMENIQLWCPFNIDSSTYQRCRKWATHNGEIYVNDGKMLDVLPFIPRTVREQEFNQQQTKLADLSALERWYVRQAPTIGRNNTLIKYAFILLDNGFDKESVKLAIQNLNQQFDEPLDDAEIGSSIFVTIDKR